VTAVPLGCQLLEGAIERAAASMLPVCACSTINTQAAGVFVGKNGRNIDKFESELIARRPQVLLLTQLDSNATSSGRMWVRAVRLAAMATSPEVAAPTLSELNSALATEIYNSQLQQQASAQLKPEATPDENECTVAKQRTQHKRHLDERARSRLISQARVRVDVGNSHEWKRRRRQEYAACKAVKVLRRHNNKKKNRAIRQRESFWGQSGIHSSCGPIYKVIWSKEGREKRRSSKSK